LAVASPVPVHLPARTQLRRRRRRILRLRKGQKATLALSVPRVPRVTVGKKGHKGHKDRKAPLESKERKVTPVQQVPEGRWAFLALLDPRARMVRLARRVHLAYQVHLVGWDLPASKVCREIQAQKAHRANLVLQGRSVSRARRGLKDQSVSRELMDGKGSEAGRARTERMACLVLEAREANQEKMVPEELLVYPGRMASKD
jgi:hypothetical protein